jgi:hypothetical protein|tara:strand:- start:215 stop:712 length:498 start_codon:yes stop_codon:yes gene_type:complete
MATVIRGDDNFDSANAGKVLQIVNVQDAVIATSTATIPLDDTIPQITEGTEFMTLAITPTSATSRLQIEVSMLLANGSISLIGIALFQDTTASAIASTITYDNANIELVNISLSHNMVAGTTSETTFKIRMGSHNGSTVTFNGRGGSREYGGTNKSSITITEYAA